ncbi:15316_t:CDS:1, partial [Cetraspora pellucida]
MSFIEDHMERSFSLSTQEVQDESVSTDTSFRNSRDRLTLDTLRILCSVEGLSSSGSKKDLVERFASRTSSKIKGKVGKVNDALLITEHKASEH